MKLQIIIKKKIKILVNFYNRPLALNNDVEAVLSCKKNKNSNKKDKIKEFKVLNKEIKKNLFNRKLISLKVKMRLKIRTL